MILRNWLNQYQQDVIPYNHHMVDYWLKKGKKVDPLIHQLVEKFADLYPRGKQMRGALATLGYSLAGGKNKKAMLQASMVLELLETSVLIADDIIDEDLTRRGVPTIHRQWLQTQGVSSPRKYGNDMAMLTFIMGMHLGPWVLNQTDFELEIKQRALTFYTESAVTTAWGVALDINATLQPWASLQDFSQKMHYYKTIVYSAILPLKFGAILANNQDSQWLAWLEKYATCLGTIFQIQDDIIGTFGDPTVTGKANDSDLKQGRWTILIELLFKRASAQDRQVLKKLLAKKAKTSQDIETIKAYMIQYQIVDLAQNIAQSELIKGKNYSHKLTKNPEYRHLLKEILEFMLKRQK